MKVSRGMSPQSTATQAHRIDGHLIYLWAKYLRLAFLSLAGGEHFLVVNRRRRRSDGAIRFFLYWVQIDAKPARVERLGKSYGTLIAAQTAAEDLVESGEFGVDLCTYRNQDLRGSDRYPAKLIRNMAEWRVRFYVGMSVRAATDRVAAKRITQALERYYAEKRAA